jgi:hypothetical protein
MQINIAIFLLMLVYSLESPFTFLFIIIIALVGSLKLFGGKIKKLE